MAPAATPKPIIDKLASAAGRAVRTPALAARLERDGIDPVAGAPEAFGKLIAAEISQWRELGRSAIIKLD